MFLIFSHSHAFWDEGPKMIWDLYSFNMENPMWMKQIGPCVSKLTPQLGQSFKKESIDKFWGKLWILIVSKGNFV
jgi:hypothetical protein